MGALPPAKGDPVQLTHLFQNLLANAIKFHGCRPPRVEVSAEERGSEVVYSVRDHGIGIAPEHFDRIFVIFQRLHSADEYPGTGLGLALCKRIVERHGGRIWVQSGPDAGASFHFTLAGPGTDGVLAAS